MFCPSEKPAVINPINCPHLLSNAPPELPEDIGAVNCIISTSFITLNPDIIPSDTELKSPNGLPIAITFYPLTNLFSF